MTRTQSTTVSHWLTSMMAPCVLLRAAIILVALCSVSIAQAQTTSSDWSVSTTIAPTVPADEKTRVFNIEECKNLVDSGGIHTFSFSRDTGNYGFDPRYSIKVVVGNETCDVNTIQVEVNDTCYVPVEDEDLAAAGNPVEVDIDLDRLTSAKAEEDCEGLVETSSVYMVVSDPLVTGGTANIYNVRWTNEFQGERPATPTGLTAEAGESSIRAEWGDVADVTQYRIYTDTEPIDTSIPPEDQEGVKRTTISNATSGRVTGVDADQTYYVAVTAVDEYLNESMLSESVTVATSEAVDYWEGYSNANPDADGGFCFIATAAWGSYQEPHVKVLRRFRDEYLLTNGPGRAFVDAYYSTSPPLADAISDSEAARAVTRVFLLPLYAFAIFMLYTGAAGKLIGLFCMLGLAWITARVVRRWWHRRKKRRDGAPSGSSGKKLRWVTVGIVILAMLLISLPASAESPRDFMIELKGGPYRPDGQGEVYTEYFGEDSVFMPEFEFDWQFLHFYGAWGVGASFAFTWAEGNSKQTDGSDSVDQTDLNWFPLRAFFVYRFDWLATEYNIPLSFHVKAGLDYYFWWINDGGDNIATNANGDDGAGGTFGWHVAVGGAFLLDWLAPSMANSMDVEWGINNSWIVAEFLYAQIDDFGASGAFDLTDEGTFQIGLGIEF